MPKVDGDITCVIEGQIFWFIRPRQMIYIMLHCEIKSKWNTMEHTARRFFISFYNSAPLFISLSNSGMDLERDLISIQNKYTRWR